MHAIHSMAAVHYNSIGCKPADTCDFKAKEPDFKPSCYYILSTKAREINDSIEFLIDYYLTWGIVLNGLQNIDVSRKC